MFCLGEKVSEEGNIMDPRAMWSGRAEHPFSHSAELRAQMHELTIQQMPPSTTAVSYSEEPMPSLDGLISLCALLSSIMII